LQGLRYAGGLVNRPEEKPMNGVILYEGPSALDGKPVVVIATGLKGKSRNEKTGAMVQTWIMRTDIAPHDAAQTGDDASVCGDCPHRGTVVDGKNVGRSCYVTLFQAPLSVWKTYKRGGYPKVTAFEAADLFAGRMVRLGSYGDPVAAPFAMWKLATSKAAGWTGYTHQWRTADVRFAALCMASADTPEEGQAAREAGWRTFRVRVEGQAVAPREFICPASKEAGYKTDCASCKACMGTDAKAKASPVIIAHGAVARAFERRMAA
jgi:hypothetical protein